jgi:hypothetical protein
MLDAGASGLDAGGIRGVVSIRILGRLTPRYSFRVSLPRQHNENILWFLTMPETARCPVSGGALPLHILRTFCVKAARTLRGSCRGAREIKRRASSLRSL